MSERREQIRKALESVGVDAAVAWHTANHVARLENRLQAEAAAYARAVALGDRHRGRGTLTFEEAVEAYRIPSLCEYGTHAKVGGAKKLDRDALITSYLRLLHGCGLSPKDHPNDRRKGKRSRRLSEDERKPTLAGAMEKATGIGQATIRRVWKEFGRPDEPKWG